MERCRARTHRHSVYGVRRRAKRSLEGVDRGTGREPVAAEDLFYGAHIFVGDRLSAVWERSASDRRTAFDRRPIRRGYLDSVSAIRKWPADSGSTVTLPKPA